MASKPFVDIPFGPFLPDFGGMPNPEIPGYLTDAVGIRLTPNGYRGMPAFADVASAAAIGGATTFWQGFFCESSTTRNFFVLNHSDGKIYESQDEGVTWTDATPAAGSAPTFPGHFFTYESDVIFVCQARAAIKRAIASAAGTDFSNLGGSPPIANCGAQVREHVVLGGLGGVDNYAIQTSAIGDQADWPTPGTADARAKESIRQTLPQSLGIVRQVLGGEKIGIVVQERGLTRMTYEGGDTVYAFDTFERMSGKGFERYPYFATNGNLWYWYNDGGVFATDGYSVERLDDGKIEAAIINDLLSFNSNTALPTAECHSSYDPHRHLIVFGNHVRDYQLTYDVTLGSFSFMNEAQVTGPFLGRSSSVSSAKTYGPSLYNVNQSSRKLQMLSSEGGTAVFQTGYIELDPGYRFQLQGAHLLGVGAGSYTISYKIAATSSACDLSQSGFTNMTAAGLGQKDTARDSGQYIAFRIFGTSAESHLIRGIRVYFNRAEEAQ